MNFKGVTLHPAQRLPFWIRPCWCGIFVSSSTSFTKSRYTTVDWLSIIGFECMHGMAASPMLTGSSSSLSIASYVLCIFCIAVPANFGFLNGHLCQNHYILTMSVVLLQQCYLLSCQSCRHSNNRAQQLLQLLHFIKSSAGQYDGIRSKILCASSTCSTWGN